MDELIIQSNITPSDYKTLALFGVKFLVWDELITQSNITPSDYKTLFPLFAFDISKQKENSNPLLLISN